MEDYLVKRKGLPKSTVEKYKFAAGRIYMIIMLIVSITSLTLTAIYIVRRPYLATRQITVKNGVIGFEELQKPIEVPKNLYHALNLKFTRINTLLKDYEVYVNLEDTIDKLLVAKDPAATQDVVKNMQVYVTVVSGLDEEFIKIDTANLAGR